MADLPVSFRRFVERWCFPADDAHALRPPPSDKSDVLLFSQRQNRLYCCVWLPLNYPSKEIKCGVWMFFVEEVPMWCRVCVLCSGLVLLAVSWGFAEPISWQNGSGVFSDSSHWVGGQRPRFGGCVSLSR